MQTKEELILEHGKKDGKDEKRWKLAVTMSQKIDTHVNICFKAILNLEEKKLIEIYE